MQEAAVIVARAEDPPFRKTRSATRFVVTLPVEMKLAGGRLRGSTRNLSLGGVLIESPLVIACDTRLILRLALPGHELELAGMVRRTEPGGIGVCFERLRTRDVWRLGDFLERL